MLPYYYFYIKVFTFQHFFGVFCLYNVRIHEFGSIRPPKMRRYPSESGSTSLIQTLTLKHYRYLIKLSLNACVPSLVRRYTMGQTIDIEVDINANHWGYFELKVCPVDGKRQPATQVEWRTRAKYSERWAEKKILGEKKCRSSDRKKITCTVIE